MVKFVFVGIFLIIMVGKMDYFMSLFQKVDPEISGMLLWVLVMLYALMFFKVPRKEEDGYR